MNVRSLHDGKSAPWPCLLNAAPLVVLYKHSPACLTSLVARREVIAFNQTVPGVSIYEIDVIRESRLSAQIASDLQVAHASPQVILICNGRPVWETSHFRVKAAALIDQVKRANRMCSSTSTPGPHHAA